TRAIERAQKGVEGKNFEIRKNVLKYDDTINEQRKVIYNERNKGGHNFITEPITETNIKIKINKVIKLHAIKNTLSLNLFSLILYG
ncbi:hypothetical protein ACTPEF_24700, partial [Clostridioides difficile]